MHKAMYSNSVYLHISNSGITFKIQDSLNGPVISIISGAFGMKLGYTEIITDKKSLKVLADLFNEAHMMVIDRDKLIPIASVRNDNDRTGDVEEIPLPEIEDKPIPRFM